MKTELSGLVPTAAAGDGEKGYFAIDIAFAFEGEDDSKLKDDPRYVKMIARFWNRIDAVKSETILNFHKCTPEDYNEFYPVAIES